MNSRPDYRQLARTGLLGSTCMAAAIALFMPAVASAQAAPAGPTTEVSPNDKSEVPAGDIVVTGTRVVRDGYNAPTPVSVVGAQDIARKAPNNLADFVNELPSLAGSVTPRAYTGAVSNGSVGINALNLRALGATRTLVLLDGRRVAASTVDGLVDINTIPQALVKRVDIVTGGASADWGSDAVAGVVNFILDKDFVGLKGTAQGGVTTYGDDRNYNVTLSAGTKFADGRGHIMLSGELAHNAGISGIGKRTWYNGAKIINNPAYTLNNGQPQLLAVPNVGFTTATPGGIITSGSLAGTYFGPGGTPMLQNRGSIVSGNYFTGGDWRYADIGTSGDLDPEMSRRSIFGSASFDLGGDTEIYAEGSYVKATTNEAALDQFNLGSFTIQPDNAFIPASIAAKVTGPFSLGSFNSDLGPLYAQTKRSSLRGVIGIRGDFNAINTKWNWDLSAQDSRNRVYTSARATVTSRLNQAIDAVRNAQGAVVCRSTLTNPTNGCVPYNVFGTGVNSSAVADYVYGLSYLRATLEQQVYAGTLRGDPFSTWAGPVSIATGVEHRRESISGTNDPLSATRSYFAGNYLASTGSYNVTEGFLETVVPLARDSRFAERLDLNAAVRATDYSTSGYVTTWKVGLTYSPVHDITFRATRSRDIRAPNLAELFQAGGARTSAFTDPFRGNALTTVFQITSGNASVKPEKADTLGLGVVVQPSFIPGLAASADYYHIQINEAISTPAGQAVIDQCFQGNTQFCSQISRDTSGVITTVAVQPRNIAKQVSEGLDFEMSYRRPVLGGGLSVRVLATRFLKSTSADGITAETDLVGTNSSSGNLRTSLPKWRYTASIGYDYDPVALTLTARGFSAGKINTSYIECTAGCPASSNAHTTISDNHMPGAIYFDANVTVKLTSKTEAFLAVDNIANKDPYQMPYGPTLGTAPLSANTVLYDVLGRTFRVGVRFKI